MERVDITIIGAGVIGLAIGARLSAEGRTVVILEADARHGQQTSSRNSEVIHAGIHYKPGSLKARLCVRGKELLYEYARRHEIKCRRTGKLILAHGPEGEKLLSELLSRGRENGLDDLRLVPAEEAARLEPAVKPAPALFSPSTGILSADLFMDALLAEARERGAELLTSAPCMAVERAGGAFKIAADGQEPFMSRMVINCAGLDADRVAALCGIDIVAAGYEQHFVKGEYFRLKGGRKISMPVYPPPGQMSLGLHLTPDCSGGVRVGPSAFEFNRRDYAVDDSHRAQFLSGAAMFLEGLKDCDLVPDTAGLRPRLKKSVGDCGAFIIRREDECGLPGLISLVGMESPGLTASLAIAEHVEALAGDLL